MTTSTEPALVDGWRPVEQAWELVGEPVAQALRDSVIDIRDVRVLPIDPSLADTGDFCAHHSWPPDQSANCVVVSTRRADNNTIAACVVLATDRVDINKRVRKLLDVRKLSFAALDDIVATTGMEYGGITPIGLPAGWPILVDASVIARPWVVIGSGTRRSKLALPGTALRGIPGGQIHDLTL